MHGYNLMLLRLSLAIYALARTIRIGSCYSRLLVARRGITAGAAPATVELRVLLLSFLDRANSIRSCVNITVYVDDMGVESSGSETHAVAASAQVLAFLAAAIASMRMRLSATKSVLCASRHRMGRAIMAALPALALQYRHRVTSLGAALGAGRRRNATVAASRLKGFIARRNLFRRLTRVGVNVSRLMRTGGAAALQYDQSLTGVSNRTLVSQRRAVAAATVRSSGGGDLDITLVMADGSERGRADPTFATHV